MSRFDGETVVEAGNATHTQLFNIVAGAWDDELLDIFVLSATLLPRVVASNGPFTVVRGLPPLRDGGSVGAVLADSHADLFAHGALAPASAKATQGTTLSKGDVVVMDNLSSHKGPKVEQLINAAGVQLRYSPPYSSLIARSIARGFCKPSNSLEEKPLFPVRRTRQGRGERVPPDDVPHPDAFRTPPRAATVKRTVE